ncbi:MHYT domain-containing protein [Planosporangium thailandense]|nr:MHYT domain-containing protein [Planosporangium thailandense]
MDHFTYGWVTPVFAYAMSFLGSLLGLACTARARVAGQRRQKVSMLLLATWALGGTGSWVMHFIAFTGFTVGRSPVRFDLSLTVASFATAIVVVGGAVFVIGFGRPSTWKVVGGGLFTGMGVAGMHHLGVRAMRLDGPVGMSPVLVAVSVAIAVATATIALWCTLRVSSAPATVAAAGVMGLGMCATHYAAMAAMRVGAHTQPDPARGIGADTFLIPIALFVVALLIALGYVFLVPPEVDERQFDLPQAAAPRPPDGSAGVTSVRVGPLLAMSRRAPHAFPREGSG